MSDQLIRAISAADMAESLLQIPLRRQVVQGIQSGDYRVRRLGQAEPGHGLVEEQGRALPSAPAGPGTAPSRSTGSGPGARRFCGRPWARLGQHLLGPVGGEDLIALLRQKARDGPRAAPKVQHCLQAVMSAYDALAASYDGLMADGSYRRRAAFLARRLRKSPIPVEIHPGEELGIGPGAVVQRAVHPADGGAGRAGAL